MKHYRISHTTSYTYDGLVSLCHNEARLTPRPFAWQACVSSAVTTTPLPSNKRDRRDFFGNRVHYFAIQEPHEQLTITVTSEVSIAAPPKEADANASQPWEKVVSFVRQQLVSPQSDARTFTLPSPLIPTEEPFAEYAGPSFAAGRPMLEAVEHLMNRIDVDFTFVSGATTIATPLAEVLMHRRGVCQDFAQLMIACLRSLGLAARYVSGYLETLPPPGQERLVGADASHAWVEVYDPDAGWQAFDPTNNLRPGDKHIILSLGRDFSDVTPLKGIMMGSGRHDLEVTVDVMPVKNNV